MLTPSFNIVQNDEYLFVKIHAPYTQLKEVQINVLDSVFWFYSSPYFLRLHFPCGLVDDDEPQASFNPDKGEFEVRLQKEKVGQHFPDLDLLGLLLVPKKTPKNIKPTIEVVSATNNGEDEQEEEEDENEDEWLLEQELSQAQQGSSMLQDCPKYGFGNQTSGVFQLVKSEFKEIIDLPDPDGTPNEQREVLRTAEENAKFDEDHYVADFMEPEVISPSLEYKAPWKKETPESVKLTPEEKECLKKLGNKEFLLSKEDKAQVWFSLVDIVFAYAYNHRTTEGENTVESAWTINKLSATLSWFANFKDLRSVCVSCFRRAVTYPLYRNWALANKVLKDVIAIFKLGRRRVLKCLLEVHELFAASEPRYMLNQLYITDYCIWLQHASETKLAKFTDALEKVEIDKRSIEFGTLQRFIYYIECAALQTLYGYEQELAARVKKLNFQTPGESSSSEEPDTCSETCSSEDSSELDSDDESSPENEENKEKEGHVENVKNEENKEKDKTEKN